MSDQVKTITFKLPREKHQQDIETEFVKASELFKTDFGNVELSLERPKEIGPRVPKKLDLPYHFDKEILKVVIMGIYGKNRNIRLYGSSGAGKSSIIDVVASLLHINVYRFDAHPDCDYDDIVGTARGTTKGIQYRDGTFTQFWKAEGEFALFLFEELDYAPAGVIASLNPALDGRPLEIPSNPDEGMIPRNHQGPIFSTGNTCAGVDEAGTHHGVNEQNSAAIRRWTAKRVSYMPADAEIKLLQDLNPDLRKEAITLLVNFANDTRVAHEMPANNESPLYTPMSTGELITAAYDYQLLGGDKLHLSIAMNYGNKLPSCRDRDLIQEIWARHAGDENFVYEQGYKIAA